MAIHLVYITYSISAADIMETGDTCLFTFHFRKFPDMSQSVTEEKPNDIVEQVVSKRASESRCERGRDIDLYCTPPPSANQTPKQPPHSH